MGQCISRTLPMIPLSSLEFNKSSRENRLQTLECFEKAGGETATQGPSRICQTRTLFLLNYVPVVQKRDNVEGRGEEGGGAAC